MREKSMNDLVDLIREIKLPEKHKADFFWAPRNITCQKKHPYPGVHSGYTLYVYGGSVMSLYCVNTDKVKMSYGDPFADSYDKFFNGCKTGKEIREDFKKNIKGGPEFLKGWKHWNAVCEAFKSRTDKNRGIERKRENRIANKNSSYGRKIEVFDMESNTKTDSFTAKADIMWLRFEEDNPIISFVEYKCTNGAMKRGIGDKDYSLPGHFRKMSQYYDKDDVKERVWELLNRKRLLNNEREALFSCNDFKTEIVFLFSHVNPTRQPTHEMGVSEGSIKRRMFEMYKENKATLERMREKIRFGFIKDEGADLDNIKLISAKDIFFDSEETIGESLKQCLHIN